MNDWLLQALIEQAIDNRTVESARTDIASAQTASAIVLFRSCNPVSPGKVLAGKEQTGSVINSRQGVEAHVPVAVFWPVEVRVKDITIWVYIPVDDLPDLPSRAAGNRNRVVLQIFSSQRGRIGNYFVSIPSGKYAIAWLGVDNKGSCYQWLTAGQTGRLLLNRWRWYFPGNSFSVSANISHITIRIRNAVINAVLQQIADL